MTISATQIPNPVRDFLGEFALAVHRFLIYPPDHPLLEENAQRVSALLEPGLTREQPLDLVIAGSRVVVADREDDETPAHHELAAKLRDLGIGAIRLDPTSGPGDVQALLAFLKTRSEAGEATLEPGTAVPGTSLVEVRPISLSGLEISWENEEHGHDRLVQLWTALDNAVTGGAPGLGASKSRMPPSDDDPEGEGRHVDRIANGLRATVESAAGSALAVGYLRQLLSAIGSPSGPGSSQGSMVRRRLTGLIGALDPETIRELAAAAGQSSDQASFVADMSVLGDQAVARVLKAVADPTARSLTDSLGRLFGKMARQGSDPSGGIRVETRQALRRSLLELLKEWALEDPNPTEYGSALDRISQRLQGLGSTWALGRGNEPERLLQMSIELATYGPVVERAAEYLLFQTDGGLTTLVKLVEDQDPSNPAISAIVQILKDPSRILSLASADDVDDSTLQSIVDRMGEDAIAPLLEVLAEAESRAVRRKTFDTLVRLGTPAAAAALRRLPDPRWYVTRNLLSLARKAGYHFAWFDPDPFLESDEGTIRREAYLLAYLDPKRRAGALERAIDETEGRIVLEALAELERGVPSLVAESLSGWIKDESLSDKVRRHAIRALASSRAPVVVSALVDATSYRTRFLRRLKLRKGDAVVHAALGVLGQNWGRNPEAQAVLALARRAGLEPSHPQDGEVADG